MSHVEFNGHVTLSILGVKGHSLRRLCACANGIWLCNVYLNWNQSNLTVISFRSKQRIQYKQGFELSRPQTREVLLYHVASGLRKKRPSLFPAYHKRQ